MGVSVSKRSYEFKNSEATIEDAKSGTAVDAKSGDNKDGDKKDDKKDGENTELAGKMKDFVSKNSGIFKKEFSAFLLDYKMANKYLADKNILPNTSDISELLKGRNGKYKEEFKAFVSGVEITPYADEKIKYDPVSDLKIINGDTKDIEEKIKLYINIVKISIGALIHVKLKRIIVDYIFDTNFFSKTEAEKKAKEEMGIGEIKEKINAAEENQEVRKIGREALNVKGGSINEAGINAHDINSISGITPLNTAIENLDELIDSDDDTSIGSDGSESSTSGSSSSDITS